MPALPVRLAGRSRSVTRGQAHCVSPSFTKLHGGGEHRLGDIVNEQTYQPPVPPHLIESNDGEPACRRASESLGRQGHVPTR